MFNGMDLFHNDVKRGKRDVRRNLIGFEKDSIIAEPIISHSFQILQNLEFTFCKLLL